MQAILECKQCGGQLNPDEGQKITYCKFCGSANAISVADRFGLYNRANYLRRQNEFDRAIGIYEDIIKEDSTDAEGYFGLALCKYGIEYVDDPDTGKKMPTCHRTRFTLMSQDEDFKKAIEYADSDTLAVYMDEATKIDTILKKIQQLSSKQEKYDVFICYKESDENGERTQTSVLAQDIYERLTNKGYKTFFARKTLESKLGSDYEPIIFSALYSAKVMLVIGNKPEEFQAVWVRNEWVRFMERISKGEECTLIPLYKDMSPYELPNELANIQALDMGKIGYVQDLFDGIGKLLKVKSPETVSMAGSAGAVTDASNVSGIKKRAYLFLEQGDFTAANQYFERVLDHNPEDSESYWGKLLAKFECCKEEDLENVTVPIFEMKSFQMAMRFGTEEQKEKYQKYSDLIDTKLYEEAKRREEEERLEKIRKIEEEEIARKKREEIKLAQKELNRKRIKQALKISKVVVLTATIGFILYILIFFRYVVGCYIGYITNNYNMYDTQLDKLEEQSWNIENDDIGFFMRCDVCQYFWTLPPHKDYDQYVKKYSELKNVKKEGIKQLEEGVDHMGRDFEYKITNDGKFGVYMECASFRAWGDFKQTIMYKEYSKLKGVADYNVEHYKQKHGDIDFIDEYWFDVFTFENGKVNVYCYAETFSNNAHIKLEATDDWKDVDSVMFNEGILYGYSNGEILYQEDVVNCYNEQRKK